MQGARARGGGGWTILRHTPLPPNAKKKRLHNRFYIKVFIETKDRVLGVQNAAGVGEKREI